MDAAESFQNDWRMKHAKDDYSYHIMALVQLAILRRHAPISRQMRRGLALSEVRDDKVSLNFWAVVFIGRPPANIK